MNGIIQFLDMAQFGSIGSRRYNVASGTTASILPGFPVAKALGNGSGNVVSAAITNSPVVGTDTWAGIAMSTSTETASLAGHVDVMPLIPGVIYLAQPNVATTWNTQAKYDALVGARVLLDLTNGAYTILAADSANNGLVVEDLDIATYPNTVAFSVRAAVSYTA